MTRLPQPGSDNNTWGEILNEFLTTSFNTDGTLKPEALPTASLSSLSDVNGPLSPVDGQLLMFMGDSNKWEANSLSLSTYTTDDLAEGASNFYFTDQRAIDALTGQNLSLFTNDSGFFATASKSITVQFPTAAENIGLFHTAEGITLTQVHAVVKGSTPSVTFNLAFGADRSAAGTSVFGSDATANSTTGGSSFTSFANNGLAANDMIWLTTSGISGTVNEITVTVHYAVTGA